MGNLRRAIIALSLAAGLSACGIGATSGDDGPPAVQPVEDQLRPGNENVDDETDEAYVGRSVTVSGVVAEVIGPGLFSITIGSDDMDLADDRPLLVAAPDAAVSAGQAVEVSGVVQIFGTEEAEAATEQIAAERALELEGSLMIVADAVGAPAEGG